MVGRHAERSGRYTNGYQLLWVVLLANIMAMLFQAMSAKLGIVTGRSLAELCQEHFPPRVVLWMWIAAKIAAVATDVAEFLGGALGISLLFNVSLLCGLSITAALTFALLNLEKRGFRPLELAIGALVCVIGASYVWELVVAPPNWHTALLDTFVPRLSAGATHLAVGIVGATIMPHTLYAHSGLTEHRRGTITSAAACFGIPVLCMRNTMMAYTCCNRGRSAQDQLLGAIWSWAVG